MARIMLYSSPAYVAGLSVPGVSRKTASPSVTDLGSAIGEIRQACEELGNEAHRSPYFLIVGAGISYPPVPLAANIIEHCRQIAERYGRNTTTSATATLDMYSQWFGRAYPAARQRQEYLRSLIERKPLSLASLRLAHLLSAHRLTNIVVTTNFDDFLARALRLFGEEPAVCDHPRTVGRIDRDRPDIQIVHVHGSYLFYDLANLRGEVTDRARIDHETSFTMMGLLDSLLWSRSPLVIGYSGWEGDIVMSALRRRLRGGNPLAQSIYWFCFRRSELERLPRWLRQSPDVRFVVPPEPVPDTTARARTGGDDPASQGKGSSEPTLQAFDVFDRLNESFEVGPPAIFQNPVKYFAQTLQTALPPTDASTGDPYAFKALIERLNKAAATFETSTRAPKGIATDLERLRESMRESNYAAAVRILARFVPQRLPKLDAAVRKEVLDAAGLAATALLARKPKALSEDLARIAVFDPTIERLLGDLPAGMVWCIGSRSNQLGLEVMAGGKGPHGAFTAQFAEALRDATADIDDDNRISILESTIAAARGLAGGQAGGFGAQIPVVSGDAGRMALFAARRGKAERNVERLHALLVGVNKYEENLQLRGPKNDVALMSQVLRSRERRLFKEAKVHVLQDGHASRSGVEKALESIADVAAADDIVVFYFSGHGRKTLEASSRPDDPPGITVYLHDYTGAGAVRAHDLKALLANIPAKHTLVVLDF